MKKLRWMWIATLAAGAVIALVALGGCADRRVGQEGNRGGRYASERPAAGERMRTTPGPAQPRQSGRQGREQIQPRQGREQVQPRQGAGRADREDARGGGRYAALIENRYAAQTESNGRSVVETGEPLSLTGRLESRDSEWFLNHDGTRYALHLGNTRYVESTGIRLREGADVEVRGFADGEEVAVVSILVDGRRFAFRGEDGTPLWAGRGRRNAEGSRSGAGGGRSGDARGNGRT